MKTKLSMKTKRSTKRVTRALRHGWRPISTAPKKDGYVALISGGSQYGSEDATVVGQFKLTDPATVERYQCLPGYWVIRGTGQSFVPKYWQPLPTLIP